MRKPTRKISDFLFCSPHLLPCSEVSEAARPIPSRQDCGLNADAQSLAVATLSAMSTSPLHGSRNPGCAGTKTGSTWSSPLPGATAQSMEQRFTFNEVASIYGAARPDYPEALVDAVFSYAGLKSNDAILEVGCGTGQATKSFAARGYSILAIDPGPEMVRAARESLGKLANVGLIETTVEDWPATQA